MVDKELKELTKQYFIQGWEPEKYIRELLPMEIDYFKKENKFSEVTETDILVQLVGFSWEPLFISLCAYQPKVLILVLNKEYNGQPGKNRGRDYKEYISKLMEANLITTEPQIIPQLETIDDMTVDDTPESVFKFLRKTVLPFVNEDKRIVIDITGAKKSMVSGAYLFATYSNSLVSYLDFDKYCVKFGKPYGYTCVIKKPENPMELFKLGEWLKVKEQYNHYSFGNAFSIIEEIEKETMKFIEPDEQKAVELLKECLCFYEVWDNGDYREALQKHNEISVKIPSFPCPSAVQELGEIWFSKEDLDNTMKQIEGLNDINQSIYLHGRKVLIYAQDELSKIDRLIRNKEDYRSALLRAVGLNDFLLKVRLIKLWVGNQLYIEINDETLERDGFDDDYKKPIDRSLLQYSTLGNIINFLKKKKPFTLKIHELGKEARVCRSEKVQVMEKFWFDKTCLSLQIPYDLFDLRNKAIHFCLSVPKEIADAALDLAKGNLDELKKNWVSESVVNGRYKALNWDELCEKCGIKFLPRQRRNEDE